MYTEKEFEKAVCRMLPTYLEEQRVNIENLNGTCGSKGATKRWGDNDDNNNDNNVLGKSIQKLYLELRSKKKVV